MTRTEEIRARVEKASPGPWKMVQTAWACGVVAVEPMRGRIDSTIEGMKESDADFIAHARSDVPYLLTELTALREEVERLRGALKLIKDRFDSADKAAGNEAFDERRSGLAWAMWTDAKAALSPSPAQEESVPKQD